MGQKITEDDIKYLLKNRKEILVQDRIRIKEIYTELSEEDSIEQMLSIPSYDFCTKVQSERTKQDLGNVLEHIQHMQRSKSLELRVELWGLSNEIEKINRLYICYQALSRINIQEFMIIKKMYVQNMGYYPVEMESGLSHKTFEKKRQSGIAQIKLWYESDYDNASIIIKTEKNREKRPPKKDEKSYYQMSLKDI